MRPVDAGANEPARLVSGLADDTTATVNAGDLVAGGGVDRRHTCYSHFTLPHRAESGGSPVPYL